MPKFDMENYEVPGGSFGFSGVRPDMLEETAYTLVVIAVDRSGSVSSFETELIQCAKTAVEACKKSPKAENLLVRFVTFGSRLKEVHGFTPVKDVDMSLYNKLNAGGTTCLNDAVYDSVGSIVKYGEILANQDFDVNAICYIITDGEDVGSSVSETMIKDFIAESLKTEKLESIQTVLIGINTEANYVTYQQNFVKNIGLNQYVNAGDANPNNLAKLANLISKSTISTSTSLGTGQSRNVPIDF